METLNKPKIHCAEAAKPTPTQSKERYAEPKPNDWLDDKDRYSIRCSQCNEYFLGHVKRGVCWVCTNQDNNPPKEAITAAPRYGGWAVDEFIAETGLGFRLGNVVKYISRAGKKAGQSELDDLRKAQVYLQRHIERLEGGKK